MNHVHRRVPGECEPERNPRVWPLRFVADSCLGGTVRRAIVPDHAANLGTGNPHGARRATRSALAVDADRWAASAVRAGAGLGDELSGDTHLPVDAFRNEASRSCGSVLRRCDAAGGCGSGLSGSRLACFPVRSNESPPNRVDRVSAD